MVMVSKKKTVKASTSKGSSVSVVAGSSRGSGVKSKVTVMKTAITPRLVNLPFLDKTPALRTRGAWKKKKEEEPKGRE